MQALLLTLETMGPGTDTVMEYPVKDNKDTRVQLKMRI